MGRVAWVRVAWGRIDGMGQGGGGGGGAGQGLVPYPNPGELN